MTSLRLCNNGVCDDTYKGEYKHVGIASNNSSVDLKKFERKSKKICFNSNIKFYFLFQKQTEFRT